MFHVYQNVVSLLCRPTGAYGWLEEDDTKNIDQPCIMSILLCRASIATTCPEPPNFFKQRDIGTEKLPIFAPTSRKVAWGADATSQETTTGRSKKRLFEMLKSIEMTWNNNVASNDYIGLCSNTTSNQLLHVYVYMIIYDYIYIYMYKIICV